MRLLYYPSVPDSLGQDEDDIRAGVSFFSFSLHRFELSQAVLLKMNAN